MTRKSKRNQRRRRERDDRRYAVRGVRRDPIDVQKLSKALIGLALAEAERQAQADHAEHADANDDGREAQQRGERDG